MAETAASPTATLTPIRKAAVLLAALDDQAAGAMLRPCPSGRSKRSPASWRR